MRESRVYSVVLFLLIMLNGNLFAQSGFIWCFGENAGINFSSGSAVPINLNNQNFNQPEGTAMVCSDKGQLLFYTDGQTVWDGLNTVIASGLQGGASTSQSSLIVPKPGTYQPSLNSYETYYIFTVSDVENNNNNNVPKITYYLLTNSGSTWTISSPSSLLNSSCEKIAALKIPGVDEYWVVAHEWDNNIFHSYKITSSGIVQDVISNAGTDYNWTQGPYSSWGVNWGAQGYLKFSPDGTQLVSAVNQQGIYLYHFDINTGNISNETLIMNQQVDYQGSTYIGERYYYGVEFSPNGNLLYVTSMKNAGTPSGSKLFQFDLTNYPFQENTFELSSIGSIDDTIVICALQLAPDGKIYVANHSPYSEPGFLGVINNPNVFNVTGNMTGANTCDYQYNGFSLALGSYSRLGLPNIFRIISPSPIPTVKQEIACKVFPNPTSDFVTIEAKNMQKLLILNMEGKLIRTIKLETNQNLFRFSLDNLPNGCYFVKVLTKQGSIIKKIILE